MKKLLVTGAVALFAMASSFAQINYTQNFNGPQAAILAEGWQFPVITGAPQNNGIYSTSPSIANIGIEGGAAGIGTFNLVGTTPTPIQNLDCAIVSPVFILPNMVTDISYRVGSVRVSGSATSHYSMYVLTEAEYNAATTPTALKNLLNNKTSEDESTIVNEIVDSSFETTDYTGERIRLVFRVHNSPGNSIFLVDNIVVEGGLLNNKGFEADSFIVHPNPVNSLLNITATDASPVNNVKITDINGRIIFEKKFEALTTAVVDTSSFSSGIYNVTVTSDNGTSTKKIIKS